jgi:hypothetical protein
MEVGLDQNRIDLMNLRFDQKMNQNLRFDHTDDQFDRMNLLFDRMNLSLGTIVRVACEANFGVARDNVDPTTTTTSRVGTARAESAAG